MELTESKTRIMNSYGFSREQVHQLWKAYADMVMNYYRPDAMEFYFTLKEFLDAVGVAHIEFNNALVDSYILYVKRRKGFVR